MRVTLGQRVERARQAHQPIRLLPQRLVGGGVRVDHAVAQRLEVALQIGQWRAQLVRGVGDEVAPDLLLLGQAGGHLVERVGHVANLIRALARHPHAMVAGRQTSGGKADVGQRPGQAAGQHDRQRNARDEGDADGDEHDVGDRRVVHLACMLGRVACLDEQLLERPRADHQHAQDEDRKPDRGRRKGSQEDSCGDAARLHRTARDAAAR